MNPALKTHLEPTYGTLLGGRVRYTQPRSGFRSGIEPVLLAASIPARPGQTVIEAGCGAGAGLLCLHARVPEAILHGIERNADLASLARSNATANGFAAHIVTGDLLSTHLPAADHAFANPPYHPPGGTLPADPDRRDAKHTQPGTITGWVRALAAPLRHRGTLTLALATAAVPEAIAALAAAQCPAAALLPLWPKAGPRAGQRTEEPAKLVLLRGIRGGNGLFRLLAGLVLHTDSGGFTPQAEAVLRHGGNLPICAATPGRFPDRLESL